MHSIECYAFEKFYFILLTCQNLLDLFFKIMLSEGAVVPSILSGAMCKTSFEHVDPSGPLEALKYWFGRQK